MKAVFHTCRAVHASLPGKADGPQSAFCHSERASGHLWSSLNVSEATCDPTLNQVRGGFSGPSGGTRLWWVRTLCPSVSLPTERPSERQTRRAAPVPRLGLLAQAGSPFSPWGRRVPPTPFLGPLAPGPAGRGSQPSPRGSPGPRRPAAHPRRASHAPPRAAAVHCSCIACSGGSHAVFPQCITEARPLLDGPPTRALAEGTAASDARSRGGGGRGFTPERKSVLEAQTLSPSTQVWPPVARLALLAGGCQGPGAARQPYRTGSVQTGPRPKPVGEPRLTWCLSPAGLL